MKTNNKIAVFFVALSFLLAFSTFNFTVRPHKAFAQSAVTQILEKPFGGLVIGFVPPHLLCPTGYWLVENMAESSYSGLIGILPVGPPILGTGFVRPAGTVIGFYSTLPTPCLGSVLIPVRAYTLMGTS